MNGLFHGFGIGSGWVFDLVFLGLIVWLVVVVSNRNTSQHSQQGNKSALDILKERYAKGEIGKEEFEEKKRDLMN